ncbi:hypothetical protein [Microbacterium sp. 18062]|uniref:hypothetical protein n=1 Tax=Microbacterium sp. 18062 TaxID=2681410 RepID=UPI00135BA6DD|nr:hypothetical protein [Microbacterium sp. 18062]
MTHTAVPLSAPSRAPQHTHQPVWARWGGAGILLGGALLLIATVLEVPLSDELIPGIFSAFAMFFLGSIVVLAVAMIPLAVGDGRELGIAGDRVVGRFALLAFGAVFLTNQTLYFVLTYALPPIGDNSGASLISGVLGIAQFALLLTASVSVVRAGIATGAARWALLALTVVAVGSGLVAAVSDDLATVTVALVSSTVSQIVVGLTFLAAGRR